MNWWISRSGRGLERNAVDENRTIKENMTADSADLQEKNGYPLSGPEQAIPAREEQHAPEVVRTQVPQSVKDEAPAHLLSADETQGLRLRWETLQVGFVDEPRRSVGEANQLVADAIGRLTESFARERRALEQRWDRRDSASTEDLRLALRRYRSFFERLLSV